MQVGAYQTLAQLGAGGMSLVWLARGPSGLVVLKRQLNPVDDDRLIEEAQVGMRLRHPGVVQTLDLLEHEGRPMLVLEYVAGASLVALRTRGALAPGAVCTLGADVAEALAALHEAKGADGRPMRVLHRDVSPANVIVTPDGHARLIDLGIARAPESIERTQTGDLRGTVRYLAPELFDAKPHTALTDLWALGVCLFEAALGRQAVTGPEAVILATVVRGKLLELRPGEELPPALDGVVHALCAPVERRVANAAAAARMLRAAAGVFGDGRAAAAAAVRGLVDPGATEPHAPAGPAAISDEQAFMRYAATTYCGTSDDELLLNEPLDELAALDGAPTAVATPPMAPPVSTAVTPSASMPVPRTPAVRSLAGPSPTSRPYPLAPGPAAAVAGPAATASLVPAPVTAVSQPFAAAPRSSPGTLPASDASWDLPRPTTGPVDTAPVSPAIGSSTADAIAEPPTSVTAPQPPAVVPGSSPDEADADDLAELRGTPINPWAVAAAVLLLAIIVALVLLTR
ncbi:MAG: protein kinase [Deltaproteobacteria bacterium]|nr:protein kinase [Deltaproteobacteria bacterium]